MSETLAEEEKQRIRVELITEIAKNEQDLEQCNEETGRYGREFLYNIRDLEQLCSITECPLTSHELKEFGIFPKKKNLLNRAWTHVKEIVTKPHKAEEEAARSAREKAEFEERMNSFAEQLRRTEVGRIESVIKQEEFAEQFNIIKIMKTFLDDQLRRSEDDIHERERIMMEEAERQKGEVAERFKIIEEQMRRSEEAYVQRERIAREEAVDRFTIMEKQIRRLEEARIEREQIVSEEAERQNRERTAYLEKERVEKAELQERIRVMEEQMRRLDEARIEMERWIEKEKERKIKEEEERRFREEEARIEREKAEAEERERKEEDNRRVRLRETSASKIQNYYRECRLIVKAKEELNERRKRKEKERIEKEEEDRKRNVDEERRLRIEADVKSLLALPYELRKQAYRDFDLEKRRELRINEDLAEIELKMEYRYERLKIEKKEDHVWLIVSNWIHSGVEWKMCYEVLIPIAEIEKELKIMGKNTQFDRIVFWTKSDDRQIINGMKSVKAKYIYVQSDSNLNDAELQSIVENREEVTIRSGSSVTLNGLMWIYEKMRDRHVSLNWAWIDINETERWKFLDNFGNFNRESLTFIGTNHNQEVRHDDEDVIIEQDILRIRVSKKDGYDKIGRIWFHFNR